MNIKSLYAAQMELEQVVREKCGMTEAELSSVSMMDNRIFAFKVEFAEFSNETAWFKYWKQSHKQDKANIIEELADCIHFLLTIGIHRNYHTFVHSLDWEIWREEPTEFLYLEIMNSPLRSAAQWKTSFEKLIAIGVQLGFDITQIELAYFMKNNKNVERALNNY